MSGKSGRGAERWRELIAEQAQSGLSIRAFCRRKQVREPSFYGWRRRMAAASEPMRFAVVEAPVAPGEAATAVAALEVILATGDRLRIGAGVDATALRSVIEALRA